MLIAVFVCWLVGDRLLLKGFVPCAIIVNVCVVMTVAMAMLLKGF